MLPIIPHYRRLQSVVFDLDFTNTKYSDLKKFDNQLLLNISGNKNISIEQVLEMMPKLEEYNII